MSNSVHLQRAYYEATAAEYEHMHGDDPDHQFALRLMLACIGQHGINSVLDVGSGTGRTLRFLKQNCPSLRILGIEPSNALRQIGYESGLADYELIGGDGQRLPFGDGAFDLVCEFGVLHHVPNPALIVAEMMRVARRAIYISDSNNFGQGGFTVRLLKQAINALGLWPVANWIKTKGKGYDWSEGDGISYSYSIFNNWRQIQLACDTVCLFTTRSMSAPNVYRAAGHVALLGLKRSWVVSS
jgi:SAM-dependent methyltransferase